MSQLVAYYADNPKRTTKKVEVQQLPISQATGLRSIDGPPRCGLIYLIVPAETAPLLVPFGEYDAWALRDRYNEAIRIMNTLGAAEIICETFGETTTRRGFRARVPTPHAEMTERRLENSGFDFRHVGTGSAPRDPRPLRWPDEPGFTAAVSSVLENSASEVVINIRSSRNFAVDGSLGLQLKGMGFDLGGSAESSGATSLHIRATFPQPRRTRW